VKAAVRRTLAALALLALAGSACHDPTTPAEPAERSGQTREATVELALIGSDGSERRRFVSAAPIRLRLTLRNPTEREVELTFTSGRTHDAVILGPDGSERWRWSEGRMFTQALSERPLAPGSETIVELLCDPSQHGAAALPPGRYRAAGVIPAFGEELRSPPIEFEIE
jgi:hypothetical protein